MPSFKSQREASFEYTANATFQAALSTIHSPESLISLNPLVIHYAQSPTDPTMWTIKDRLTILGCMPTTTTYTAKCTKTDDGCVFEVIAALGTRIRNTFRVQRVSDYTDEEVHLEHDVVVEASSMLMPYVYKTMYKSHDEMMQSLEGKMKERVGVLPKKE